MYEMPRWLMSVIFVLIAGVAQADQRPPAASTKSAGSPAVLINLNTATAAQLESLPGIGARTALRIIEQRQKSGSFKKIEELMNIRGIGEKSFLKLKPLITVSPAKAAVLPPTGRP